jgi:hypothetical protein
LVEAKDDAVGQADEGMICQGAQGDCDRRPIEIYWIVSMPFSVAQADALLTVGGEQAIAGIRKSGEMAGRFQGDSLLLGTVRTVAIQAVAETGQGHNAAVAVDRQRADVSDQTIAPQTL